MIVICDSRERCWSHIEWYFKEHNIPYRVEKLDTGDYFNPDNPSVVIDRKGDISEVFSNLSNGKNNIIRFTKECKRAKKSKLRFIVLIESPTLTSTKDVAAIESAKYAKYTGKALANEMFRLTMAYGVEWQFCKKNETAGKILDLLEVK